MDKIDFVKMVASGNDFVVISAISYPGLPVKNTARAGRQQAADLSGLAKSICDRKYGVGADGLLVIEKSRTADFKMRIFNPDGSEAEMCGNGLRCVALYRTGSGKLEAGGKKRFKVETKAGILEAVVNRDLVKVKMTEPSDLKMDISLNIGGEKYNVNFINTGVPHTVLFVNDLKNTNVRNLGKFIRFHPKFLPQGTNVDFVEIENRKNILLRTYERGVEGETLACGTGAVASAIVSNSRYPWPARISSQGRRKSKTKERCVINVKTESGEVLKVFFDKIKEKITGVWLEGKAEIVFVGKYMY